MVSLGVWLLLAAAFGAAVASFQQVVVDRAGSGAAPAGLRDGSRCPRCGAGLRATDRLPVLGFVLVRGRCRSCRAAIPRRHLAGECAGAAGWAGAVALVGLSWWLPAVLVAGAAVALLSSTSVRRAGLGWLLAGLLPAAGVALFTLGVGGALAGRAGLYLAAGGLGAVSLLAGVLAAAGSRPRIGPEV